MKKLLSLISIILFLTALSGCMLVLSGTNERELGTFIPVYSDGENGYFEYELTFENGIVKKTAEGYTLSELSTDDEALSEKSTGAKVIFEAYITALYGGGECADGYDYIYNVLDSAFDISDEDNYSQILLLENQGAIYGAINFYSRPSGRSGSLLTNENIVKGLYINITDGKVNVIKEFDGSAILAFNQNHLIVYRDKDIYSVDLNRGEEVFLLKDKWWDRGPTYYNDFNVSFTDEDFLIYVQADNSTDSKETLMAGNLDGNDFTVLIDNRKIEY